MKRWQVRYTDADGNELRVCHMWGRKPPMVKAWHKAPDETFCIGIGRYLR